MNCIPGEIYRATMLSQSCVSSIVLREFMKTNHMAPEATKQLLCLQGCCHEGGEDVGKIGCRMYSLNAEVQD